MKIRIIKISKKEGFSSSLIHMELNPNGICNGVTAYAKRSGDVTVKEGDVIEVDDVVYEQRERTMSDGSVRKYNKVTGIIM